MTPNGLVPDSQGRPATASIESDRQVACPVQTPESQTQRSPVRGLRLCVPAVRRGRNLHCGGEQRSQ
ncbi:hypothetical protein C0Q70_21594 [Pomacea canaliculata]|uniref:Uncharacterized protein n=1 Tax=Pomacea canaliculata TaxID=400727 RepID=A0A2T7ND02_POMCA|nr:hypothetical protein C0Q70_21594 [Pomacea canaliculata]